MALADDFPYAVHVTPLHAWRSICETRQLLSKDDRLSRGIEIGRASTRGIDDALGFTKHVHFYLVKDRTETEIFENARMLGEKLLKKRFPHIVILIDLVKTSISDWFVSAWNIARYDLLQRPVVDVVSHHAAKRTDSPNDRKGDFYPGLGVPLISQKTYATFNGGRCGKELLVPSPFTLPATAEIWALSRSDSKSLNIGPKHPWKRRAMTFPRYGDSPTDLVSPDLRERINQHLREGGPIPALDFD